MKGAQRGPFGSFEESLVSDPCPFIKWEILTVAHMGFNALLEQDIEAGWEPLRQLVTPHEDLIKIWGVVRTVGP